MADERVVGVEEARKVVPAIVLAFGADPVIRWFMPDAATFLGTFPKVATLHAVTTAAAGGAFCRPDRRGGAFWYPPGARPDGEALGVLFTEARALEKGQAVFGAMAAYEPAEPHWYLRQIGVDPALQRSGHGSALIEVGLRQVDARGDIAYLEATTAASRDLYARHGFVVLDEIRAMGSPPLWPMIRRPV